MIALDTNVLVRLVVEDDQGQAAQARQVVKDAEAQGKKVLLLAGVLLETVWVLCSGYGFQRNDIALLLDVFLSSPAYAVENRKAVQRASLRYRVEGDFADLLFVELAKDQTAGVFFSFDRELIRLFPDYARQPGVGRSLG